MSREPGDGEGQGTGKRSARRPRPSPSDLSPAERLEKAREAALRLLSHRERSRRELRTRLRAMGFDSETVEAVLDGLGDSGLQSDDRFASEFVAAAQRSRGLAALAIQSELRRRGVDELLAAEASAESPEAEEERARATARKRAVSLSQLPADVRARRLAAYLARRGYSQELCRRLGAEESVTDEAPSDVSRDLP